MADAEAAKRKEPEPEAAAAPAAAEEPEAKKAKTEESTPAAAATKVASKSLEPKVVRKQVEYYLSDENLRHDKFFHEKISADPEGWLEMGLVLTCNKMKAMGATKEDVVKALEESKLELKEGNTSIRRPGNAPLPKLEAKPMHHAKKSSLHAHDGGAIVAFSDLPAEMGWLQVKEKLKEKLPGKATVWFASEVDDKGFCYVACSPFEGDIAWFKELEFELGGKKLKCEVCENETLQKVIKMLPKHTKDKRENQAKRRQKERNKPFVVGKQNFTNIGALRGKVKEILNSRSDGEQLKADGTDFKLIKALMEYHPKGKDKSAGLTGIKVAKSPYQESRCFYIIKGDTEEDVSMMKCIAAVEANPPYVKVPEKEGAKKPAEKPAAAEAADTAPAAAAAAAPAAEAKEEAKAEEAKPAAEEEKKPAEEAAAAPAPAAASA